MVKNKWGIEVKPERICAIDASTNSLAYATFHNDKLKEVAKGMSVTAYKDALKKYMPVSGALSEGIEEAGTQFAQNAIDILSESVLFLSTECLTQEGNK